MSSGLYGSNDSRLSSKAGVMEFAITMNTTLDDKGRPVVNYKEVKKMFDFICRNVKLPDVTVDYSEALIGSYKELLGTVAKQINKKPQDAAV